VRSPHTYNITNYDRVYWQLWWL